MFQTINRRFDLIYVFDFFLFFLSFWILGTEKNSDFVLGAREWLLYFNALFIIDLFFRILSLRVEILDKNKWNHTLPCIFTLIFWMLAAYYKFDNVFGSKPTQGFNIFLFITYHIGMIIFILLNKNSNHQNLEESNV